MKVPIIVADYQGPIARVGNAGAGSYAMAEAGNVVSDISAYVARNEAVLRQKERLAQDTMTALDLDNKLAKATAKIKESFLSRSDTENFDKDAENQILTLRDELAPKNASQELTESFARSFNKYSQSVSDSVSSMKYRVMEEKGRNAIGEYVDNAANEYAATDDPNLKDAIKKGTELRIRQAINTNLVNPVWGENQIREFERYAKAREVDAAKGIAIDRLDEDPGQLAIDLDNPKYLPAWVDKSERERMIIQAKKADKALRTQNEELSDKALRKLITKNDLKVTQEFRQGKLTVKRLDDLADNQMISREVYDSLSEKLLNGDKVKENNPEIIGQVIDLYTAREFNEAKNILKRGLKSGDITLKTYETYLEKIGDRSFSDASHLLKIVAQPGWMDTGHILFNKPEAQGKVYSNFINRIRAGEDPWKVAESETKKIRSDQQQSVIQSKMPKFMNSTTMDLESLMMAEQKTLQAYKAKQIGTDEYKNEMQLIKDIRERLSALEKVNQTVLDMEQSKKEFKVGK